MDILADLRGGWPRNLMVAVAIASSIALTLTMISLAIGVRESTREVLDRVNADLYVLPEGLNPLFRDLQKFDQGGFVIKEIMGSPHPPERISPRLKDSIFLSGNGIGPMEVLSIGIVPDQEADFGQFRTVNGSWFRTGGDPLRENYRSTGVVEASLITGEIMISKNLARRLGVNSGDKLEVSPAPDIAPVSYTVSGIYMDLLSGTSEEVLLHLGEMQFFRGYLERDALTEVLLGYSETGSASSLATWSEEGSFRYRDIVDIHSKEDILGEIYQFTDIVSAFSVVVITVTLLVAVLFTSTIMMISSHQRASDLAVLRALGMTRRGMVAHNLKRSLAISMAGGIAGIAIGLAVNRSLNDVLIGSIGAIPSYFRLFTVNWSVLAITFILILVMGMASGTLPAITSSLRSPVSALRRVR